MILVALRDWYSDSKMDAIDYEEFKKYWPLAPEERPKHWMNYKGPCRVTYEEARALAAMGIDLEIKPYPGAMLTKIRSGRHDWDRHAEIEPQDLQDAKVIQITVPDQALMLIDEVAYLEDCCTDELQDKLDNGWRILAVCPPNAQRRPDYILGRRKHTDPFDNRRR